MIFINDAQVAQAQQANLDLIRQSEHHLTLFAQFLAELVQLLLSLERRRQQAAESEVDLGIAQVEPPALPGSNPKALPGRDRTIADISVAPDAVVHRIGLPESPHSLSYQADGYTLESIVNPDGSLHHQVSTVAGRCCLSAIATPGGELQIEHLDSHLSPDALAHWDAQLSAIKTLNARPQKDLDWVKECYESAPDWCPRGTTAILIADQVMRHTQTSTFYSDKVGMTFTRTEAGIDLIRQDRTVACRLDATGIQSHLTPQETAYFRDAYNQFVQAQAAHQQYGSSPQVKLPEAKGIERAAFAL